MNGRIFLKAFQKLNKWHVIVLMISLLVANFAMMGVSFARYRTEREFENGLGVSGFSPALEGEGFEGDFKIPGSKSFTVTNDNGRFGLRLTVTVETQGVLPLSYKLFAGTDEVSLVWNEESGSYVSECVLMPAGTAAKEFVLESDWIDSEYQEHYGGLVENVRIRVLCEQLEE